MAARLTYLLVIAIWSTTPLAIKLGGDSLAPAENLGLRILLALVIGSVICTVVGSKVLDIRRNWKVYAVASIGIFPNMMLVYMSAEYISSGLIALLFGLSPFFTALLSKPILGEWQLNKSQVFAIVLAAAGLAFIFFEPSVLAGDAYKGVLLMMGSNVLFSTSGLVVRRMGLNQNLGAMEQALGAMFFSVPGILMFWYFATGFTAVDVSMQSLMALGYLAVLGSLVGFAAYFYILQRMTVDALALIPLITPVMALILGNLLVGEQLSFAICVGAGLIVAALAFYQGAVPSLFRRVFC